MNTSTLTRTAVRSLSPKLRGIPWGKTAYQLIYPLTELGRCTVLLGQRTEALPLLERAIGLPSPGLPDGELTHAHFWHGRALVELGSNRVRGLAEARAARTALASIGAPVADERKEADAWLARFDRSR